MIACFIRRQTAGTEERHPYRPFVPEQSGPFGQCECKCKCEWEAAQGAACMVNSEWFGKEESRE